MNDKTINTEVTMRDTAPAGGAKRFRPGDEILGRYVVEAELGQGGMGVVYLCLDKVAGVKVAVKGLPPEVSHNSDEMESVRENFQLVSELQHPNIAGVRTLEVDAATGNYYLIMTYARGSSLKHWLRQHGGKSHRDEQLKVLRQIASALDYAHNAEPRHIIHRDIKPENIMVDERGNVSVLDFGLAAQVRSSLSRVSQLVTSRSGTPAYKSPEQWLAQPQRAPSDQYALGVIAYQMYSGELPYDSDDVEILKHAVAFDPVPEIPDEDRDVNAVLAKVLAKKANERFPSCTAFVDALEGKCTNEHREKSVKSGKSKAGNSVSAQKVPLQQESGERSDKKRGSGGKWLLYIGGLILLACGIGALVGWLLGGWSKANPDSAEVPPRTHNLARRSEVTRQRKEAASRAEADRWARVEAERLASEKRKADEARLAAEEAARKAKAETERLEAERRKAVESRLAAERAEAERKAKEDADRALAEASQKAIELFKKGDWQTGLKQSEKADQSNPDLQFWLGTCYDIGLGANCDAQKAVACFRLAAEGGQVDAQCELGRRYESGRGVVKDISLAKRWYQAAASQGSTVAETSLRRVYELENASAREASLARERAQKEREDAERKAREAEEAEKVRKLREDIARLKEAAKNVREEPAEQDVPTSDRTRRKFDGTPTMARLKFSSKMARRYYVRAAESASEGAHNKANVRAYYDKGRECGGPVWPELEAWLDWWK